MHSVSCYIVHPPVEECSSSWFEKPAVGFVWAGTTERIWPDVTAPGPSYSTRDLKGNAAELLLNVGFWTKSLPHAHSLAHYIAAVLVYHAVSPVAPDALVHLTLGALKPHGTDAFHAAVVGNGARLRVHAVVVANIWKQHETTPATRLLKDIQEHNRNKWYISFTF